MTVIFELGAIDRHFAEYICREAGEAHPWLGYAAALASNAVANGHTCLNLTAIAGKRIHVGEKELVVPGIAELKGCLEGSCVVGAPGAFRPLVLDAGGRLYLYRYWKYERDLARVVLEKARSSCADLDEALLKRGLCRLFPKNAGNGTDWQQVAAVAALWKKFCVISGGPGTGKTSTVVKILALLLEQADKKQLRIALAAPTGKSAARLKESIRLMKETLDCPAEIRALIPEDVSTIHRLLGPMGNTVRFRHSSENPLPHDLVIVDEASMVALPLMAKLATALTQDARLILLGDRDQLASVDAGAVLGDICGSGRNEPFSPQFAHLAATVAGEQIAPERPDGPFPPLTDSMVVLKRNYRFGADSGIGAVARAVNAGEGSVALEVLRGKRCSGVGWRDVPAADRLKKAFAETIVAGYGAYLAAASPAEALELFDRFRVLCALRQGAYGVAGVNAIVEEILAGKGLIDPQARWYPGRPVMITVNDYNLKLFNGDVGIILPDADAGGTPRVYFPAPGVGVRKISPVRLPAHETVYAMTIHKSQGSEFDRVLMLLPGRDSETMTRELIYTGITRARLVVEIWGTEEVFLAAVSRRIDRKSGLGEALWGDAEH